MNMEFLFKKKLLILFAALATGCTTPLPTVENPAKDGTICLNPEEQNAVSEGINSLLQEAFRKGYEAGKRSI